MSHSLLGAYVQFLRSPVLNAAPVPISKGKAQQQILQLYSIHLLLILVVGAIIQSLGVQDSNISIAIFKDMPAWVLFIVAVVAAPLIEELIFRLPLRAFAVNLSLSGSLVVCTVALLSGLPWHVLTILGTTLAALNIYVWMMYPRVTVLQKLYSQYPRFVFYFFTVLFGALHITNYEPKVWPLLPLLVLPQMLIGLWLGFVRLRYGFGWAVFAHGFHNGCVLIPIFLFKVFGSAQFQAQGFEASGAESLPPSDQLLLGGVGIFVLGGLVLCILVSGKLIREWAKRH